VIVGVVVVLKNVAGQDRRVRTGIVEFGPVARNAAVGFDLIEADRVGRTSVAGRGSDGYAVAEYAARTHLNVHLAIERACGRKCKDDLVEARRALRAAGIQRRYFHAVDDDANFAGGRLIAGGSPGVGRRVRSKPGAPKIDALAQACRPRVEGADFSDVGG